MPNWCSNNVVLKGTYEDLEEAFARAHGREGGRGRPQAPPRHVREADPDAGNETSEIIAALCDAVARLEGTVYRGGTERRCSGPQTGSHAT